MDRVGSASSPETTIRRSSSEEDRKRKVEGSSSSLDTVVGPGMEEKRKGRFGALKSSFRKEGGLFHLKKRNPKILELDSSLDPDADEESARAKVAEKASNEEATPKPMKKKKKSHSLVRKLSLNKFRTPVEQSEQRRTPEGGDSSRSLSRSSPDSQSQSDLVPKNPDDFLDLPKKDEHVEPVKLASTVTVIPQKSPQLTLKSTNKDKKALLSPERSAAVKKHFERVEENIAKTFPEAFDVWPPPGREDKSPRSESGSESEQSPRTCLAQRRKALAEERRAFFQRRKLDSTADTSGETVVEVDIEDENRKREKAQTQKKARQISVRKFDTFSTFEGTFDEDTGVGYLAGIEEARSSLDNGHRDGDQSYQNDMANVATGADGLRSVSQESSSTQNNVPSSGVGEKREHLYKILVIGELGAGKTSIIKRYVHQFFSQHYRATIGVDFALKVLNWDPNTIIRLQLWDIAGQERFGNMTRVYYKEAVGAFIVFDVTRSATLDAVVKWKHDLDSKVQLPDGSPIPCVLLANKCDQQKEGLVNNHSKMEEYCKEKNFAGWFETSAKENVNIEEAARFLVGKILQNDVIMKGNESQDQNDTERFALNQPANGLKKTCSC